MVGSQCQVLFVATLDEEYIMCHLYIDDMFERWLFTWLVNRRVGVLPLGRFAHREKRASIMLYIQGLRTSGAEAPSSSAVGLKGRCEGCAQHTKGMKPQDDRMNGVKIFALYPRNVSFPVYHEAKRVACT
ncbi:unnamed protein product [Ectocarpus sp. 6 AP-2014]